MPMRIKEAAKFLGVHPNTLRNLEKQGLIHPYRFGKRKDRYYSKWMLVRAMSGKMTVEELQKLNLEHEEENQTNQT